MPEKADARCKRIHPLPPALLCQLTRPSHRSTPCLPSWAAVWPPSGKGSIPAQEKAFKPVSGGFGKDSAFEPCRVAAQKWPRCNQRIL